MLKIFDINKKFGEKYAVKDLNLELQKGEVLGLLGRNGAGKTTTIKMILNLIEKDSGEITWDKEDIKKANLKIGYLPEERGLYPKTKVKDQLFYFAKLEGIKKNEINKKIDYWLERFNIMEHKNKIAGDLSKGNQQKVQIIANLIHDPDLIILDEPFSGLDPVNANSLSEIISELIEQGKTIVLSSHQMNQVEKFVDKVCLLKNGEAIVSGDLKKIKKEYGYKNLKLEKNPEIEKVLNENSTPYTIENNHLKIKIKNLEEALNIIEKVKKNGIEIDNFSFLEPTLNDIFIERMV